MDYWLNNKHKQTNGHAHTAHAMNLNKQNKSKKKFVRFDSFIHSWTNHEIQTNDKPMAEPHTHTHTCMHIYDCFDWFFFNEK